MSKDLGVEQEKPPPYIIAEMSGNHGGSLEEALRLVDAVADAGADAIKLQTYTADSMTLDLDGPDFVIQNEDSLWKGRRIYELYEEAHTPWEWHAPIYDRARSRGIECFSSPFSKEAVDLLVELGSPRLKIASLESIDHELVAYAASSGLPLVISTGLSTAEEIEETLEVAREAGCDDLTIMKCTSSYPTDPSETNLATIADMRETFGVDVGLSDHTLGIGVPIAAVPYGVTMIEKHVTLDRNGPGTDAAFSLEPDELRSLVTEVSRAHSSIGRVHYGPTPGESGALMRRRSLYITEDLPGGTALTRDYVRSVRPNRGLAPKHLPDVVGRKLNQDVAAGTPLSWELLEDEEASRR